MRQSTLVNMGHGSMSQHPCHVPTPVARSRFSCLSLRLHSPRFSELPSLCGSERAYRCEWSVISSKFEVFGGGRRVPISRIQASQNYSDRGEEDESDDEDPVYENVDQAFSILRQGFYQVCRLATKTARGWLPPIISTQLISFTVGGVVILTALWVLRAFLEIGCVAGTFIFIAIVAIRTLWSFVSYFGEPPVNGTAPDDKGRYRPSFSQPE